MNDRALISRGEARTAGVPRYFTGRPCKNGHVSERYVDKALCVECNNAASQRYRDAHPGIASANVRRWMDRHPAAAKVLYAVAGRRWRYGLTPERFAAMLDAQQHQCALCRTPFSPDFKNTRPHVDHCHSTNVIRGLLCHRCNAGIGHFRDDPELLVRAAAYLKEPRDE